MSLLNERYQRGAELLANENLAVRVGGIGVIENLAHERPQEYLYQVVQFMCAFAQHPLTDTSSDSVETPTPVDEGDQVKWQSRLVRAVRYDRHGDHTDVSIYDIKRPRRDVVMAVRVAADGAKQLADILGDVDSPLKLELTGVQLRSAELNRIDLTKAQLGGADLAYSLLFGANLPYAALVGANLSHVVLEKANLAGAHLNSANLAGAHLDNANLAGAHLVDTILAGADLADADLQNADLRKTDLTGAQLAGRGSALGGTRGLTQSQLDEAVADPDNPPNLEGVVDAESGEQLVWRGGVPD